MIITAKKKIPFLWILFAALPGISFVVSAGTMGTFIFSLRKFVDNPVALTFILSLPTFISLLVAPVGNFFSDRIWTRFGRRKPFIASAWVGMIICLSLMPLMPNFWMLVALFLVYYAVEDVGGQRGPIEPLTQEIVPPHQRGRSTGVMQWAGNIVNMGFYFVAFGRFDDVRFMAGVPIGGEKAIYWIAALMLFVVLMFVTLGIREIDQKSALVGQRVSLRSFFTSILDRDLWPVFLLIVGNAALASGLGSLGALLYTEEWGFSKQDMGTNVLIGGTLNIFVIAFLVMIADKLNRMRAYQVLLCLALATKVIYFVYIEYILADKTPSLIEVVVFGETLSIIGILTGMVYTPLVYDYVVRNKMGTFMAGSSLVSRMTALITLNGVGLFVWAYSSVFQPAAGEMARVVLREDSQKSDVVSVLRDSKWYYPQDGAPASATALHAEAWYRTGLVLNSGYCWEVRLRNKDSSRIANENAERKSESSKLVAEEKLLRDEIASLIESHRTEAAAKKVRVADAKRKRIDELDGQIKEAEGILSVRSANLKEQIVANFGGRILTDGEQVRGITMHKALVLQLPTSGRPDSRRLEKALTDIRTDYPNVIDLRPIKIGDGYGIAVSSIIPIGESESDVAGKLQSVVEKTVSRRYPTLLRERGAIQSVQHLPALSIDLQVIEEPLDKRISPITRIVNRVLAVFDSAPQVERRVSAIARNLRLPGETEHVAVTAGADNAKTITITTLVQPSATRAESLADPIGVRISQLLAGEAGDGLPFQARAFYDRIEKAAAAQRITIARPFVGVAYAPLKYNYMSGYLWIFTMGLFAIGVTVAFKRREAKGLIFKRGVAEEAASVDENARDTSAELAALTAGGEEEVTTHRYYKPGHARRKLAMCVFGLSIMGFGLSQLWPSVRLVYFGAHATAEATRVIKTKNGLPDRIFNSDPQIQSAWETRDRSYTFWNEFRFSDADGRPVVLRCPVGSQLKPLYPLLDGDGLPTSQPVCYDPNHPESALFPNAFSTWFIPGVLTLIGLLCATIGAVLFRWANVPIRLPHIPSLVQLPQGVAKS